MDPSLEQWITMMTAFLVFLLFFFPFVPRFRLLFVQVTFEHRSLSIDLLRNFQKGMLSCEFLELIMAIEKFVVQIRDGNVYCFNEEKLRLNSIEKRRNRKNMLSEYRVGN